MNNPADSTADLQPVTDLSQAEQARRDQQAFEAAAKRRLEQLAAMSPAEQQAERRKALQRLHDLYGVNGLPTIGGAVIKLAGSLLIGTAILLALWLALRASPEPPAPPPTERAAETR